MPSKGGQELVTADLATSFQQAVVDVLVGKTLKALETTPVKQFNSGWVWPLTLACVSVSARNWPVAILSLKF